MPFINKYSPAFKNLMCGLSMLIICLQLLIICAIGYSKCFLVRSNVEL